MTLRFRILVICFLPLFSLGQSIRPEVQSLVDSIISYGRLDGMYIGYYRVKSGQFDRLNLLTEISYSKELLKLTESKNTTIKCAAFQSLCLKDSVDIIPIVMSNLYDTSMVSLLEGCSGSEQMVGDYFLETFSNFLVIKDSSYYINNYARIVKIDSILFYDPAIRLAYKEARIKETNGDTLYYGRIREIALKERIPVSVLALAKYKRQQDKEIIASYFANDKTQYYAIWAVREFPDTAFYPLLVKVFENAWKARYYDYAKWRVLYQALARYPNEKTLELFDKTINARNKFRRETLGRYLAIAIAKYPNPFFEKYLNKIEISKFHREILGEEAKAEN